MFIERRFCLKIWEISLCLYTFVSRSIINDTNYKLFMKDLYNSPSFDAEFWLFFKSIIFVWIFTDSPTLIICTGNCINNITVGIQVRNFLFIFVLLLSLHTIIFVGLPWRPLLSVLYISFFSDLPKLTFNLMSYFPVTCSLLR